MESSIKNLITADLEHQISKMAIPQSTPDEILESLIENVRKIDFWILAFPKIVELREEIKKLKAEVYTDGNLNEDKKQEEKEYLKLLKELKSLKLTKNHYLILCIEQLL